MRLGGVEPMAGHSPVLTLCDQHRPVALFLKWDFPVATSCCPSVEACRICAWQVPAEIVAGLVLVSSFGGMMRQVFRVRHPS